MEVDVNDQEWAFEVALALSAAGHRELADEFADLPPESIAIWRRQHPEVGECAYTFYEEDQQDKEEP